MNITSWHIAFVQSCNLRCTYCITNYGRYNSSAAFMDDRTSAALVDFIHDNSAEDCKPSISFSAGETFLRYESFMNTAKRIMKLDKIKPRISVVTNGVLLDNYKMDELAEMGISLKFSIDGPEEIHDKCRIDAEGMPTFSKAFANWNYYRKISENDKSLCSEDSVITDSSGLKKLNEFWQANSVPLFNSGIQLKNEYNGDDTTEKWNDRNSRYLTEFEEIANRLADSLDVPFFLSDFKGPRILYDIWNSIFSGRKIKSPCSIGTKILGVDAKGDLYPCEGFFGYQKWIIGNIFDGLNKDQLDSIVSKRNSVLSSCSRCSVLEKCVGGCFAAEPYNDIVLNYSAGCSFAERLYDIALKSYNRMLSKSALREKKFNHV